MSSYKIKPYSFEQAKKLGVEIKPSTNPKKKIDVFEKEKKIASIGDVEYKDYPTYMEEKGKEYANERRRLYHLRHKEGAIGTPNFFSKKILW